MTRFVLKDSEVRPYGYTKTKVSCYKIHLKKSSVWAYITIDEWANGGGSFSCQSDYGNYEYMWSSIGPDTLREFMMDCDFHYFMEKVTGYKLMEFDAEETTKELYKILLSSRRLDDTNKFQAREIWDELKRSGLDDDFYHAKEGHGWFERFHATCPLFIESFCYDLDCVPMRDRANAQAVGFWEIIWPIACDIWTKELADENSTQKAS